MTREEKLAKRKLYRENNKQKIKEAAHNYYLKNKDDVKKRHDKWTSENIEHLKNYHDKNREHKNELRKLRESKNIDIIKEKRKLYRENNKEKIKEQSKIYREKNKDILREKQKQKRQNNYLFRLRQNISTLIRNSLYKKSYKKSSKTQTIIGCTFPEFKLYLESKFETWMSWENYGICDFKTQNIGWDIDHIIPISSANTEDEIIKLNYYTNLQPLCSYINRYVKKNN